jgi:hypothetical protein
MRRTTTMRDIARLRKLAATGITAAECDAAMGKHRGFTAFWAPRYGIVFARYASRPHPALADLAMARLAATMQRLQQAARPKVAPDAEKGLQL